MNPRPISAIAGSLMLAATAAFHGSGFPGVTEAAAKSGLNPQLQAALAPLWIFPSVHWVFVAIVAGIAAATGGANQRLVLILCAAVVAIDAALLYFHLGPFPGEAMLAFAAIMFLIAALRRPARG